MYKSVKVGLRYTVIRNEKVSLHTNTSRKCRVESPSFSRVNLNAGCILFKCEKNHQSRSHSQIHKKCRLHNENTLQVLYILFIYIINKSTSGKPAKIPAIVEPKSEPSEIPVTCLYMMLLKLNSTDVVVNFINSTNTTSGISGWVR